MENKKKEEIGQGIAMTKEDFATLWKSTQNAETEPFSKKSAPVTGVTRW